MSAKLNDVAVIGLGVMGGNLARNFASRGLAVGGYTLHFDHAQKVAAAHPEARLDVVPVHGAAALQHAREPFEQPHRAGDGGLGADEVEFGPPLTDPDTEAPFDQLQVLVLRSRQHAGNVGARELDLHGLRFDDGLLVMIDVDG